MHLSSEVFTKIKALFCDLQSEPTIVITNPPMEIREEVNKRSKKKEELKKKLEKIRLEPKERQSLARLFIKEVKMLNDKVDVEFLVLQLQLIFTHSLGIFIPKKHQSKFLLLFSLIFIDLKCILM